MPEPEWFEHCLVMGLGRFRMFIGSLHDSPVKRQTWARASSLLPLTLSTTISSSLVLRSDNVNLFSRIIAISLKIKVS